jgi:hypothetical protein
VTNRNCVTAKIDERTACGGVAGFSTDKEDVRRVIEFWEGSSLFLTWTIAA